MPHRHSSSTRNINKQLLHASPFWTHTSSVHYLNKNTKIQNDKTTNIHVLSNLVCTSSPPSTLDQYRFVQNTHTTFGLLIPLELVSFRDDDGGQSTYKPIPIESDTSSNRIGYAIESNRIRDRIESDTFLERSASRPLSALHRVFVATARCLPPRCKH